jgi:type I restriction enzyme S subunit
MSNGWEKKTIGDLFDVQLGKMLNEKAKRGSQYPYLANFNVRWGGFDLSKLNEMHFTDRERDKYELRKGDLLMCEGGEIGRCAIWQRLNIKIYYQKALHRLRPQSADLSTDYLYFYMEFIATQGKLTRIVGETSIAHLTREKLLDLPIIYPPLPEQKAIAYLLATWDEAIEKTERLIQVKEKRFKSLLRELISEPRNRQKVTGWKKVRIGSFLTESRIQDRDNDPKKRLSVRLHLKGVEVREYRGTESDGATAYFIRKAGQFIYGKQNIFKGAVGIVPLELDGYSSTQDIPAFDVADHVDKHWLLFLFSYSNFYKKLELYASGSGSKRLQPKELFGMKISLPPFEVQQEIAEALFFAQHEIDLLKQLAERYKTQKRGLMQKMLTGEWRVKPEVVKRYA